MNVAGIDYSSRAVDLVLIHMDDLHSPLWFRYPLTGKDAFDRTRSVADVLPGRASTFFDEIIACGIEHPGGHHGTRDMLRVQGAILSMLPARLLVEPWPPSKWRQAVGLPGNATKAQIYGALSQDPLWPQDACDAYCIALATRQAIRTEKAA